MSDIRRVSFLRAKDGEGQALAAALLPLQQSTEAEPGCREFHFLRSVTDPALFCLTQHFLSAEALAEHNARPPVREFLAAGLVDVVSSHPLPPATENKSSTLIKFVKLTAKAGRENDVATALPALRTATLTEPACHRFDFYRSLTQPRRFGLHEEFADSDALARHMQLPHTQAFFALDLMEPPLVMDLT